MLYSVCVCAHVFELNETVILTTKTIFTEKEKVGLDLFLVQRWAEFYTQKNIFPLFIVENIKDAHAKVDAHSVRVRRVRTAYSV